LLEQLFDVIGVFEVPVPVVATGVGSNQLLVMINAEPLGKGFKRERLGGITAGYRIAIDIEPDPKAAVGAQGVGNSGIWWQRLLLPTRACLCLRAGEQRLQSDLVTHRQRATR